MGSYVKVCEIKWRVCTIIQCNQSDNLIILLNFVVIYRGHLLSLAKTIHLLCVVNSMIGVRASKKLSSEEEHCVSRQRPQRVA